MRFITRFLLKISDVFKVLFKVKISTMYSKFLLFFSATVFALDTGKSFNRNETLWNKLTTYKDLTGISDEEMLSVWKAFEKRQVREGNAFPKFRVAMSKPIPAGTINPVFFDRVQFNEEIEYKNGVILIMQPGYYTFTVQARAIKKGDIIGLYIKVENIAMTYSQREFLNS